MMVYRSELGRQQVLGCASTIGVMDSELRQRAALVAMLLRPGVSWTTVTLDALECGDTVTLLERALGGDNALIRVEDADGLIDDAAEQIREWEADGTRVHAFFDATYPAQLRDIHEMPPILFTRGRTVPERRAVAVVGSRKASSRGRDVAASVARELAARKITVVSGLAAGVDAAAHRATLDVGGRTVAVIGTGIRRVYPVAHRNLQAEVEQRGLVISQFLPDAAPTKRSFPMRNAVMSGYAAATVVVEAGEHSGARIQARYALAHGRPVIMPDSLLVNEWARDFQQRPGVHVVRSLPELLATVEDCIAAVSVSADAVTALSGVGLD